MNKKSTTLFNSHLSLAGFPNARVLHIVQGDLSVISFELKDKNEQIIPVPETEGSAQIIDPKTKSLKYYADADIEDGKVSFILDRTLPVGDYEVYIKVGEFYFPSSTSSFTLRITKAYDVVDLDTSDIKTIDVVVEGLRDDVIAAIESEISTQVTQYIADNPESTKGEKGDPLRFEDLTEAQKDALRGTDGEDGRPFAFEDLTGAQQEALRGHPFTFEDFTPQQLEDLKLKVVNESIDPDGNTSITFNDGTQITVAKGQDGKSLEYKDLTPEELATLQLGLAVRPPQVYTRAEYDALTEYDPHVLYIVTEEE